jgi:hypothetical protein
MKAVRSATRERQNNARQADQISRRSDLHKEWCNEIFISRTVESVSVFRATIKPAYQRRISISSGSSFGLRCRFSSQWGVKPQAKISSNQC